MTVEGLRFRWCCSWRWSLGLQLKANLAVLNVDKELDELWRGVWKPLFDGFIVGIGFVALFVFHGCVLVVVNDRVTGGQDCFERCAARESRRPVRVFDVLARVDDDHRKAVLVRENEVAAMTWSEEAEIVRGGDADTFGGALVRDVAVDQLPAREGVRDFLHACLIFLGLEAFEPDKPCGFEVHLKLKSAALGAFTVLLVAVVVGKVAATFAGRGWKVVVCSHGRNLEAHHRAVQTICYIKERRFSLREIRELIL